MRFIVSKRNTKIICYNIYSDLTMSFKSGKILFRMTTEGGFLMREKIMLVCTECLSRNYNTTKNKQTQKDRLEIKKFCPTCNTHTLHKESK